MSDSDLAKVFMVSLLAVCLGNLLFWLAVEWANNYAG